MTLDASVAVVIPVYKHSVLLAEAVESVLSQSLDDKVAIIIVDDGCPFEETQVVGRAYAESYDNVVYLRKQNGGLSSARNFGIDYALRHCPSLAALYFLDADNRITRSALNDALTLLRSNPEVDWIYPNIDKIGIEWNGNYTPPYSRLLHLTFDNICEAGSLVSRRLLDCGVRFDENMKAGFEDWDFWLQAIAKGLWGRNCPTFGFEYRQRAESMLRASNRERQAILHFLQQKHKGLFSTDYLLQCEHIEAPRYGAVGEDAVCLFTDPTMPASMLGLEDFVTQFWAARAEPESFGVPPYLCWIHTHQLDALKRLGIAQNVFWLLERCSDKHHFVALHLENVSGKIEISLEQVSAEARLDRTPDAWMTRLSLLTECVLDTSDGWARSLYNPVPGPSVMRITIRAPFLAAETAERSWSATDALIRTLGALRSEEYRANPPVRWNWREAYLPPRSSYYEFLRRAVGASPVMPRLKHEGQRSIGFLLPIAAFGGVEKVAYGLARVLKDRGYDVHLFVLGSPVYQEMPGNEGLFASINFLASDYPLWGGPHLYYGHELLMGHDWAAQTELVTGFLGGMDVIINCQVAPVNAVLGELRRKGTKIVGHWHVLDRSENGREVGHPYLALAFEHVYDLMLTCSQDLADWLHGMGVPRAKVLHVPNAPSYELSPRMQAEFIPRRATVKGDVLKVIFLGRLDRQKGIERILAAVQRTQSENVPVNWRIIGSEIVEPGRAASWREQFAELGVVVEEPIYDPIGLAEAMAGADVLVLPSRWEGAPLVILEAQRLGCVPIATDVGAVGELISHSVDGVLLKEADDSSVVDELIAALKILQSDHSVLGELSRKGMDRAGHLDWSQNSAAFLRMLEDWLRINEPVLSSHGSRPATPA